MTVRFNTGNPCYSEQQLMAHELIGELSQLSGSTLVTAVIVSISIVSYGTRVLFLFH